MTTFGVKFDLLTDTRNSNWTHDTRNFTFLYCLWIRKSPFFVRWNGSTISLDFVTASLWFPIPKVTNCLALNTVFTFTWCYFFLVFTLFPLFCSYATLFVSSKTEGENMAPFYSDGISFSMWSITLVFAFAQWIFSFWQPHNLALNVMGIRELGSITWITPFIFLLPEFFFKLFSHLTSLRPFS